jgi:hypothetical protein
MWGLGRYRFRPHYLVDALLYVAALDPDENTAKRALYQWAVGKTAEDLIFYTHKLVVWIEERFPSCMEQHAFAREWQSIHRIVLLRAKVNRQALCKVFPEAVLHKYQVVVVGELYEQLIWKDHRRTCLDQISVVTLEHNMEALSAYLVAKGATFISSADGLPLCGKIIVNLRLPNGAPIRIIRGPNHLAASPLQDGFNVISKDDHVAFLKSSWAAYVGRPDQYFFSMASIEQR